MARVRSTLWTNVLPSPSLCIKQCFHNVCKMIEWKVLLMFSVNTFFKTFQKLDVFNVFNVFNKVRKTLFCWEFSTNDNSIHWFINRCLNTLKQNHRMGFILHRMNLYSLIFLILSFHYGSLMKLTSEKNHVAIVDFGTSNNLMN